MDLYFDTNNNNNRFREFITEIYIHFDMILQYLSMRTHPEQATAASSHVFISDYLFIFFPHFLGDEIVLALWFGEANASI